MRVLVVDDDPGSRLVAQAAVERPGHECLVADDGDSAWEMFQRYEPHVVVTDLVMPGMDGLELCRAIRAHGQEAYTYLMVLTSFNAREDVLAGLEAGADDYVAKPLDPFVLHSRLLVAQRVTSLHAQLARYRAVLSEQARTDPLTGLPNRLKLTEDLDTLHERAERYGQDYALAMCDVDRFKEYNDTYGHQAGDRVLQEVAAALAGGSRRGDGVYRFGGEEFLLVLPNQSWAGAKAATERARASIEALAIAHSGSPAGVVTVSAGASAYTQGHRPDLDTMLAEADRALYAAKAAGRNTVALSEDADRTGR
ncbi:GGDEF domain-containing response regulator [Sinomonas halotolerans]|uniref:Diguanylate cyclase n=1 Tax=Sinomonas halotolerans TaxID=1644133 RepID=A0ABU9X589_9MICC